MSKAGVRLPWTVWNYPLGCATPSHVRCQGNTRGHLSKLKVSPPRRKIDVTSKSPVGDISVVTLIRTDTTLDHSQKAEKVWWDIRLTLMNRTGLWSASFFFQLQLCRIIHTASPANCFSLQENHPVRRQKIPEEVELTRSSPSDVGVWRLEWLVQFAIWICCCPGDFKLH